jgi:NADH-quinone oxidoreductase subunit G
MNRCIHCTRCVRFSTEVAGVPELGTTSRGEAMEIGTYVEKAITTELSGNLIDICPVGALTSRPYAFVTRPWELRKTDSVDVLDANGVNIRVDSRSGEVLRVLPRANDEVNEEWLHDRGRFSLDGLKRRRLDRPWVKRDGKLRPATWTEAFDAIAARVKGVPGERIGAAVGDLVDAEAVVALKDLMAGLGSRNLECRVDGAAVDLSRPDFYRFNSTITGIDEADALLIVGSNPRQEAPVLNARIRRRSLATKLPVGFVGPRGLNLTYGHDWLGDGPAVLRAILDGSHRFCEVLRKAERPMLILGRGALMRPDGASVLAAAWRIAAENGMLRPDWHGFNLLHLFGGQVAPLELGFAAPPDLPPAGPPQVLWLLGADGFDVSRIPADTFVIYQGHHGEAAAARADVILPGAAYTEKEATWVNTEGRAQRGRLAVHPPGEAREDWKIIRAASEVLGARLPYDTLPAVRARLAEASPVFARVNRVERRGCEDQAGPAGDVGALSDAPFALPIKNYWQADVISRASEIMAECARVIPATSAPAQMAAE